MQHGTAWIDANSRKLIALAQEIWEYAEVAFRETRSSAAQTEFLEKEGFSVDRGVGGLPTAFLASYGQGRPIIGYLGEFDALRGLSQKPVTSQEPVTPGANGHGCGHNLLGVASLGAAIALKREIMAGAVRGSVHYYGCPAEEGGSGKVFMARAGLFHDLDAAISWHPRSITGADYGSNLAVNSARFAFHGRTSHAGGSPHLGISALDAVELMNIGVNFLREHVIQDARIHYVITHGGGQPNVVPDFAESWYYVRAPQRADVEDIYARVVNIAKGAALMTGTRLEVKFEKACYNYLPNQVVTDVLQQSLHEIGGVPFDEADLAFARRLEAGFAPGQKVAALKSGQAPRDLWDLTLHDGVAPPYGKDHISHGSTDVSDVSWIVPTGQIGVATAVLGTPGHSWQMTAASGMSIGHKGMITAAKAMGLAGYRLLGEPDLLRQAQEAFSKATDGKTYVCPIPDDVRAPI